MHPTICFIVLTTIVGIEGQLENFEPKKDDSTTKIGGQLENVDPKKEKEDVWDDKRSREYVEKMMEESREFGRIRHMKLPKVFVEVLDVGRCRKAVKDYCPCGWAMCVWRANYSCTNELTKCCPVNYDIKCCDSEKACIKKCDDKLRFEQSISRKKDSALKVEHILCTAPCRNVEHCAGWCQGFPYYNHLEDFEMIKKCVDTCVEFGPSFV
uniref:TIL domain-containing protein n=1 Tax=Globodera pallida TaxID=36090 RepID=A0A183CBB8_GLOPA